MKTDICKCGQPKDHRAIRCRKCIDLEKAAQPCKGCGRCEPEVTFGKRYYKCTRGGRGWKRRNRCKECCRNEKIEWRENNREEWRKRKKRYYNDNKQRARMWGFESRLKRLGIKTHYQIVKDYIKSHNGLCEICGQPPVVNENLSIDHCHKTGEFRGLLCSNCNNALGHLKDNPDLFIKAVKYINRHNQEPSDSKAPGRSPTI